MNFEVIIDGTNVSDYVVSFQRDHDICQGVGTFEMMLASNLPINPDPFDSVLIREYGDTAFTGYVDTFARSNIPAMCQVEGTDVLKRARDFFIPDPIVSSGETVTYWIEYFLNLCGLTSHNVAYTADVVPTNIEFNFEFILDILKKLCATQGWVYFADKNGTIQVGDLMNVGQPILGVAEGRNLKSVNRHLNDSWLRNQVVVWGWAGAKGVATDPSNPYFDSGETRTAAVHLLSLTTDASAQAFADELLGEFSEPLDLKDCEVALVSGDTNPQIGDTIAIREAFTDLNTYGLITSLSSSMSTSGAILSLYLDGKCPAYWGWGPTYEPEVPSGVIWLSTDGSGVWRFSSYEGIWVNVSGDLSGDALYVREIEIDPDDSEIVWIATLDGVYKYTLGVWTKQTLPTPDNDAGDDPAPAITDLDFVSIDVLSESYVVATARHKSLNRGWIYILESGTWDNWQVGW